MTLSLRKTVPLLAGFFLGACGRPAEPSKPVGEMTVQELEAAAKAGRAEAAGELGQRYYFGKGVDRAVGRASDLFQQAAKGGHVSSMHNLAVMLQHGEGLPKDEAAAFGWFLRAAEGGHLEAARFTGLMYKLGVGTEKNPREALRWLEKSGNPLVFGSIAELHFKGEGVPQDYARAREWWLKAARTGDGLAYAWLSVLYEEGLGVPADRDEAARWRKLASSTSTGESIAEALLKDWESTDPEILTGFGLFLEKKGRRDEALTAMRRAAKAGSSPAREWLEKTDR